MTTTRRQLLLSIAQIGAGGCVYLVLGGCGPSGESCSIDISGVWIELGRVHPIGQEYRKQFPEDVNTRALERRLLDGLPRQQSIEVEVNRRLAQLIREDFATDRVFLFQNWILSQTEGQLSALAKCPVA